MESEQIKEPKKKKQIAFIYHKADNDGLFSAVIGKRIFHNEIEMDDQHDGDFIDFIGYNYGEDDQRDLWLGNLPEQQYNLYIFVDITPPLMWLWKIENDLILGNKKILIFDHHEKRCDDIRNLDKPNIEIVYGGMQSGAKTLYKNADNILNYFNPVNIRMFYSDMQRERFETILELVNDYDIWKFDSPDYGEDKANQVLCMNEYLRHIHEVDLIADWCDKELTRINDEDWYTIGNILVKQKINDTKFAIAYGKEIEIDGMKGFLLAAYPNYWCRNLLREKGEYQFYIGYHINHKYQTARCSIRELDYITNVREIAAIWGGGGHTSASGFQLTLPEFYEKFLLTKLE